MKLIADLSKGMLQVNDTLFKITCNVRSIQNGARRRDEVIRSIPGGKPYDPRPFPTGTWNISEVEWQKDWEFDSAVYGPCKIRTDACQEVKTWLLDEDGDYLKESENKVIDRGYLLHYSESSTTLGCIRLQSDSDAIILGNIIEKLLKQDTVELEVI
jgi:hypothetical protein